MELITNSPEETMAVSGKLGELAFGGTVIVLDGPLGAGKTSFVKGLAKGLGILGVVNSPTFNIVKEYSGRLNLYHFDLYRISDIDELWELGFDEYFGLGGVCALEWGERAEGMLPSDRLEITLEPIGEESRRIVFSGLGPRHKELAEELIHNVTGT